MFGNGLDRIIFSNRLLLALVISTPLTLDTMTDDTLTDPTNSVLDGADDDQDDEVSKVPFSWQIRRNS